MTPELAALAVHDLKNALGVLEGQLVAMEAAPTAHQARSARAHCEQLRRELVAFLTLYRDEGLCAQVADESPSAVLTSLVRTRELQGSTHDRVTLNVNSQGIGPAFWYFDARLVRLALDAAVHNALRFARAKVVLQAARRGDWLVLSVSDDGPGLSATMNAHDAWSTGLGTALCRAVAKAHRNGDREGEVRLFDSAQGGACFELVLP